MTRIEIDEKLERHLSGLTEAVELCDRSGTVLGRFVPQFDASKWDVVPPLHSVDELRRRIASNEPTYTTEEVLAHLERL